MPGLVQRQHPCEQDIIQLVSYPNPVLHRHYYLNLFSLWHPLFGVCGAVWVTHHWEASGEWNLTGCAGEAVNPSSSENETVEGRYLWLRTNDKILMRNIWQLASSQDSPKLSNVIYSIGKNRGSDRLSCPLFVCQLWSCHSYCWSRKNLYENTATTGQENIQPCDAHLIKMSPLMLIDFPASIILVLGAWCCFWFKNLSQHSVCCSVVWLIFN